MSKLQQITRKDGSIISSINIPREVMETMLWKKGDDLRITSEIEDFEIFIKIVNEVR